MSNSLFFLSNSDFLSKNGASIARIMNYATAIADDNTNVILTSKLNKLDAEIKESENKYIYYLGTHLPRIKYKINDVYFKNLYFISYFRYIKNVYEFSSSYTGNKCYLLYPDDLALLVVSLIYLKIIKRERVIIEKNELMLGIAINYALYSNIFKFIILFFIKIYLIIINFIQDILSPFFSGMIVISTNLERLYKPFNKNIIRIPILCETLPICNKQKALNNFSFGYAGNINQSKDGISTFLEILAEIKSDYEIDLHIWGNTGSKTNMIEFNQKISNLGLKDIVYFHGNLNHSDLFNEIQNMDLLILPRPLNLQTKYGFSTKLGEYLMSGVPVLVTDVSDNKLYIKDNDNGFIVKNNSNPILLKKVKEILTINKEELSIIGAKGRQLAIENFDNRLYSKKLKDILFLVFLSIFYFLRTNILFFQK